MSRTSHSHITTVSSREFTRDVAHAKRAAAEGPVFITTRGKPEFALLRIEEYYEITGKPERTLLDLMDGLPATGGVEFEAPRLEIHLQVPELA